MPDLFHSLLKQDIGHLRIIAELWGIELNSTKVEGALEKLTASVLDPELLAELIDSLSPEAGSAITDLINSGGRLPWTTFTRKYGDLREAGAGKRDREKIYRNPASTAEILYFRGLLARAFFDTQKGPQEFAYIPDDLFSLIENAGAGQDQPPLQSSKDESPGRPASPGERGMEISANDHILDDATTLLAALRMGRSGWQSDQLVAALLISAKLIKKKAIQTESVKAFLEAPRPDALKMLYDAWLESTAFNELRLMPGIVCEGEWSNQPQETREFLLNLLDTLPEGKWWSLNAFVRGIREKYADFQRPAGDYDSWFIKRASDGQYLRGFSHWDQVDGALIKFFITDILHRLGQVDVSVAAGAMEPTAFRIHSGAVASYSEEKGRISVSSNGKIRVERRVPRAVRYQIARFCEWEESKPDEYRYQLTARSLKHAREQGLKAGQLLALLVKHTEGRVPPPLVKALKRWDVNGTEARVETQVVLRVSKPEVLEELRKSKAGKFLGEILSPAAVIVKSGAVQNVLDALTELGLFADVEND